MRRARRSPGPWNWLFFPGGPGIGSESLLELVAAADCPGTSWLVDLPGDGSNVDAPGAPADPYRLWPHVLLPAATPTLILSGGADRIVDQGLWNDPRYRGEHVRHVVVEGGAHFLWIERPEAVGAAFAAFAATLS
jgi:pimeloyl-ACP methyl ester carboxylesterase